VHYKTILLTSIFLTALSFGLLGQSEPPLYPPPIELTHDQAELWEDLSEMPAETQPPAEVCRDILRAAGVPETVVVLWGAQSPPSEWD